MENSLIAVWAVSLLSSLSEKQWLTKGGTKDGRGELKQRSLRI